MSIIKHDGPFKSEEIVVVSSAPQIRYPDWCHWHRYGKAEGLVAFR
jgi:hypothetical protein